MLISGFYWIFGIYRDRGHVPLSILSILGPLTEIGRCPHIVLQRGKAEAVADHEQQRRHGRNVRAILGVQSVQSMQLPLSGELHRQDRRCLHQLHSNIPPPKKKTIRILKNQVKSTEIIRIQPINP